MMRRQPLTVLYRRQPWREVDELVARSCPDGYRLIVLERDASGRDYEEHLAGADALVGSWVGTPWPFGYKELASSRLLLIQLLSSGYDGLDMQAARSAGIPVAGVADVFSQPVAEHAIMLMLALLRNLVPAVDQARTGAWRPPPPVRLAEDTALGLVGMGHIGRRTAELAVALGFTVRYFSPHQLDVSTEEELHVSFLPFDELLAISDVVSLSVPLNPQTEGLISRRELRLMKPTSLLVNVSRGKVVDETALVSALRSGQIAGAGLDVLAREPPEPDNELLKMANVIVTPHQAGSSPNVWSKVVEVCWDNMSRVTQGSALRNRIC